MVPSTVLSLLANPVYLGQRVWNRKNDRGGKNPPDEWVVAPDAHPAIIDEETWLAAQAQLSTRKVKR
ncbi:recombinase family protein [Insulibacter thermoxylanivorax]|uniref:recombinase family protein n=1 Tax=Insulibacter thermoxylanivorax TaxID=2749268 RepID=UPI001F5B08FD|nr:recombinase family protein [Insulibacter thermoxylanivorax]